MAVLNYSNSEPESVAGDNRRLFMIGLCFGIAAVACVAGSVVRDDVSEPHGFVNMGDLEVIGLFYAGVGLAVIATLLFIVNATNTKRYRRGVSLVVLLILIIVTAWLVLSSIDHARHTGGAPEGF